MASSYEIQTAIADIIATAAPNAIVKPRDILGKLAAGDWEMLRSAEGDGARIHGWIVTKTADTLKANRQNYAEYSPRYTVWAFLQYATGDNTTNSEKEFLDELDAVRDAFVQPLDDPLTFALPPSFDDIRPAAEGPNGKLIHIARGVIVLDGVKVGCE